MWLSLGQLVLRVKSQMLRMEAPGWELGVRRGGELGKGSNTFLSHRQVGVTAGFAGSGHLMEQGWLEIWQLGERESHEKRVKMTSYTLGAVCGPQVPGHCKSRQGTQSGGTAHA